MEPSPDEPGAVQEPIQEPDRQSVQRDRPHYAAPAVHPHRDPAPRHGAEHLRGGQGRGHAPDHSRGQDRRLYPVVLEVPAGQPPHQDDPVGAAEELPHHRRLRYRHLGAPGGADGLAHGAHGHPRQGSTVRPDPDPLHDPLLVQGPVLDDHLPQSQASRSPTPWPPASCPSSS